MLLAPVLTRQLGVTVGAVCGVVVGEVEREGGLRERGSERWNQ